MKSKRTYLTVPLPARETDAIARADAGRPAETISRRDMRALLDALEHPRRPNAALRAAFRWLEDFEERDVATRPRGRRRP